MLSKINNKKQNTPDENKNSSKINKEEEIGGQKGLDPTRYGDWEKNGRVSDF